jgi:hypothetical protein
MLASISPNKKPKKLQYETILESSCNKKVKKKKKNQKERGIMNFIMNR